MWITEGAYEVWHIIQLDMNAAASVGAFRRLARHSCLICIGVSCEI